MAKKQRLYHNPTLFAAFAWSAVETSSTPPCPCDNPPLTSSIGFDSKSVVPISKLPVFAIFAVKLTLAFPIFAGASNASIPSSLAIINTDFSSIEREFNQAIINLFLIATNIQCIITKPTHIPAAYAPAVPGLDQSNGS